MKDKKKKINFEDALSELEEITQSLESGELSLEDSIKAFTRGVELKKICEDRLSEAEKQIKILEKGEKGVTAREIKIKKDEIPDKNEIQGTLL
jgi:exodeoxyribonuclease VII small subunit